jgi:hypothetical protein
MLLALDVIVIAAVLMYSGGLLAIGAIVAPTVFRSGISAAADLMTTIFTRFDRVAVALVVLALIAEAVSVAMRGAPLDRLRIARGALVILFSLSVGVQSGYLSPTIARLHTEGVRRYEGPRGIEFDRVHNWSSRVGKVAVSLAIAAVVAVLLDRARQESRSGDRSVDAAKTSQ